MKKMMLWIAVLLPVHWLTAQVAWRENASDRDLRFKGPMPSTYRLIATQSLQNRPDENGGTFRLTLDEEDKPTVFRLEPSPVAMRAPFNRYGLKAYRGTAPDGSILFLTVTPQGFMALIRRPDAKRFILEPFDRGRHILYPAGSRPFDDEIFTCETPAVIHDTEPLSEAARPQTDSVLYTFKTAILATYDFSRYVLDRYGIPPTAPEDEQKTAVLGVILFSLEWVNSIFERDLAVRFYLAPNNDKVIILDTLHDPIYQQYNVTQIRNLLRDSIGAGNYDIGQQWNVGRLGGKAYPAGQPCGTFTLNQARHPASERYIERVVCHELGHAFGAHHTFANYCGGHRYAPHAVEPGSGTTIMSYSGLCVPYIQKETDEIFHSVNLPVMFRWRNSPSCGQRESYPGNRPPVVEAGPSKIIPKETPFVLTARASDPDGDVLTYAWEQTDPAPSWWRSEHDTPPQSDWTEGPLFRAYLPSPESSRYFPRLDSLAAGMYSTTWEVLPAVSRTLHFAVTVRDNQHPVGHTATDTLSLTVDTASGPFRITSHTAGTYHWRPGETRTLTWDPAGTNLPPVNCQEVDILYSTDAGLHFPYVIARNVPNTGSYTFTVPSMETPHAAFMVKASDNYFFDVTRARIIVGDTLRACDRSFTSVRGDTLQGTMMIRDTLFVPEHFMISDVNVRVKLDSMTSNRISLILKRPGGKSVLLWHQHCSQFGQMDLTFDDEGMILICAYLTDTLVKPYKGRLSVFDREDAYGPWILEVYQRFEYTPMVFREWELIFCRDYTMDAPETALLPVGIYPNPAADRIYVRLSSAPRGAVQLKLFDLSGKPVREKTIGEAESGAPLELSVRGLARGLYVLEVRTTEGTGFAKVLVESP
ncbi:MAG: T9SS type A sorting domain-containing protein [Chlorobi bacterium]|nr:T9SS type A sorting domain-containing protein [Chlorobiota bacterium]